MLIISEIKHLFKSLLKKTLPKKLLRKIHFQRLPLESKNLFLKRKKFYLNILSQGDLFFDVGANVGNRIEPIIDSNIRIVAIEPQEKCARTLRSRFGDKVTVVDKGLGEREETRTMHISNQSVLSSFSEDWINKTTKSERFDNANWDEEINVEMTTLDSLISKYGKPKFIKIDVEGFELEVLKGLNQPVNMISFEYTIPEQTDRAIQCIDRLVEIMGNTIKCNYSSGESMDFSLDNWITPSEMKDILISNKSFKSGFGDIYIKADK